MGMVKSTKNEREKRNRKEKGAASLLRQPLILIDMYPEGRIKPAAEPMDR